MKFSVRNYQLLIMVLAMLILLPACSSYKRAVRDRHAKTQVSKSDKEIEKRVEKHLKGYEKKIIEEAFKWEGTPYVYGRDEKGVATDCSGMVMRVFEKAIDCKIPRNSAKQAEFCDKVSKNKVRPGDLVFFITNGGDKINHVGIMIDDEQFIHASSKGVRVSSLESSYYKKHFKRFGRVPCMKH